MFVFLAGCVLVALVVLVTASLSVALKLLGLFAGFALVLCLLRLQGWLPPPVIPHEAEPEFSLVPEETETEAYSRQRGREGEQRVQAVLDALGLPNFLNVVLDMPPGAKPVTAELDHLVLVPWGIVVIETKTYSGFLETTDNPEEWQLSFQKSGTVLLLQNPHVQNRRHVRAVRWVSGLNEEIVPLVVLAGQGEVSREVAEDCVPLAELEKVLHSLKPKKALSAWQKKRLAQGWEKLALMAQENAGRTEEHIQNVRQMRG